MDTKYKRLFILSIAALVVNVILSFTVQKFNITFLYLDTIGTIFIAVLYGPWYGALVGTLSNLAIPLLTNNPKIIPFFIVNALVGIIVGFAAKKYKFDIPTAVLLGIVLGIVGSIIGTSIAVWLFGGITGSSSDAFIKWLEGVGGSIFTSVFIPKLTSNLVDKIISCIIVYVVIKYANLKKVN